MIGGMRFTMDLLFLHSQGSCYLVMLSDVMHLSLYSTSKLFFLMLGVSVNCFGGLVANALGRVHTLTPPEF